MASTFVLSKDGWLNYAKPGCHPLILSTLSLAGLKRAGPPAAEFSIQIFHE